MCHADVLYKFTYLLTYLLTHRVSPSTKVAYCCVVCWWSLCPSVLWHCWLGDRKGIRPVKSWVLVCWWWRFDWSLCTSYTPVVTTTIIKSRTKTFWNRLTQSNCHHQQRRALIQAPAHPGGPLNKWHVENAAVKHNVFKQFQDER